MSLKMKIKHAIGYIRGKLCGIKSIKNIYIGKDVKILGGSKISIGKDVCIRPHVDLWCAGKRIAIGNGTDIGERCRISIANSLDIGEKVLMSPNVYITDCDHAYSTVGVPIIDQGIVQNDQHVIIKDDAYIGINAVIVGNVTIGKGSVIGANSVVTKSIPDYCVAVGSPARVIRRYDALTNEWKRCI